MRLDKIGLEGSDGSSGLQIIGNSQIRENPNISEKAAEDTDPPQIASAQDIQNPSAAPSRSEAPKPNQLTHPKTIPPNKQEKKKLQRGRGTK